MRFSLLEETKINLTKIVLKMQTFFKGKKLTMKNVFVSVLPLHT